MEFLTQQTAIIKILKMLKHPPDPGQLQAKATEQDPGPPTPSAAQKQMQQFGGVENCFQLQVERPGAVTHLSIAFKYVLGPARVGEFAVANHRLFQQPHLKGAENFAFAAEVQN